MLDQAALDRDSTATCHSHTTVVVTEPRAGRGSLPIRPMIFGLLATLGLLAFYLGIITLAQGWTHALQQLAEDRWFVSAIALGFGTQIGLFIYMRGLHAQATASAIDRRTGGA